MTVGTLGVFILEKKEQEKPLDVDEEKLLDNIARTLILIAKEISKNKTKENQIKKYGTHK